MQLVKTTVPTPKLNRAERRRLKKSSRRSGSPGQMIQDALDKELASVQKLIDRGQNDKAHKVLLAAVEKAGDQESGHYLLGKFFFQLKDYATAYPHFKQAAALGPKKARNWFSLGFCLIEAQKVEGAQFALEKACELDPNDTNSWFLLGKILYSRDDLDGALAAFEHVIALKPDFDAAIYERAITLQLKGDFEAAKNGFKKVLESNPDRVDVHYQLAQIRDSIEDPAKTVSFIEEKLSTGQLSEKDKVLAHFTLGKIRENEKKYEEAFKSYSEGNRIRKGDSEYDFEKHRRYIDELIECFQPDVFQDMQEIGCDSELPVFIVGMPRSGTTLVETITASHGEVKAGGERREMFEIAALLKRTRSENETLKYPRDIARMNRDALKTFRKNHLAVLEGYCSGDFSRTTDKLPFNYLNIGLISVFYPKARIIHCMRNPIDTCLSCFFHNFSDTMLFSCEQESLGFYYKQYQRLMAHWREVLPDRILDIQYEELVADQDTHSKRLIDYLGLDWDDVCLQFHDNVDQVKTASNWQVRQPIYKSSVERWRRYEKFLGPLHAALAEN